MYLLLVALGVLILDQGTKHVVLKGMMEGDSYPIIENIFHLTFVRNPGAAFGIMPNKTYFFIGVSLVVLAGIIYFYQTIPKEQKWLRIAMGLIAGGAVGNLIDRVRFGHVVDFFDFRVWPVFNIADSAIVVAVTIIFLHLIREGKNEGS
ncbi:MAG: signal peptidase II [Thermincolia bacterium]